MRSRCRALVFALLLASAAAAAGQDAEQIVRQAVQTELTADAADHSHWLYLDTDQKPGDEQG